MQRTLAAVCGVLIVCGGVLVMGAPEAHAQRADRGKKGASEGRWSLGAGVGYTGWVESPVGGGALAGLGGLGVLSNNATTSPLVGALVEYRSSPSWAWAFMLDGSYASSSQSGESSTDTRLQASVGGRYIFNPGGVVEVSGLVLLFGSSRDSEREYREDDTSSELTTDTSESLGGGLALGLVLERELMEQMWVRVGSQLARASYQRDTTTFNEATFGESSTDPTTTIRAGVAVVPSLALRLSF